jgi:hypothetical protein
MSLLFTNLKLKLISYLVNLQTQLAPVALPAIQVANYNSVSLRNVKVGDIIYCNFKDYYATDSKSCIGFFKVKSINNVGYRPNKNYYYCIFTVICEGKIINAESNWCWSLDELSRLNNNQSKLVMRLANFFLNK